MALHAKLEAIFKSAASTSPRFALSAAYAVLDADPNVMTAGPTIKDGSTPVAPDACWHIGSISKSFTATLVMRLVDKGVLELDIPIGTHLPRYIDKMHTDWKSATLRQLLSHTAGMPANAPRASFKTTLAFEPYEGRRKVLSEMWGEPLSGKSGKFGYSNIGYVLAGIVAEEATGKSWEDLIVTEVAEPLGLTSLGFGPPKEDNSPRGHRSFFGYKRAVEPDDPSSDNPGWMGPAGTIHLNMSELVKWGQTHIRAFRGEIPEFLTQQSCKAMQSPISKDYGLGWVLSTNDDAGPVVWHNGSNTMWYSVLTLFPEKQIAIAVATNSYHPRRAEKLLDQIAVVLASEVN